MKNDDGSRDLDWENRVLCSDENCIGVIGTDGRCKECGMPHAGELPVNRPLKSADELQTTAMASPDAEDPAHGDGSQPALEQSTDTDIEWEQRTLCRDEACIGVIGADGRCKECGSPVEG